MTDPNSKQPALILASSSPYRRELLQRFHLPFESIRPDIDESHLENESAAALALRLAKDKARFIAKDHPQAIVIGSDQVLACDGELLGKPGNHANAVSQLQRLSGHTMTFYTALSVVCNAGKQQCSDVVTTEVRFRRLSLSEIEAYLAIEPAYDCAGSCKAEGLGISLCASIESEDPTAIIGLPLISLRRMLAENGIAVP
jgi:septum formation protein